VQRAFILRIFKSECSSSSRLLPSRRQSQTGPTQTHFGYKKWYQAHRNRVKETELEFGFCCVNNQPTTVSWLNRPETYSVYFLPSLGRYLFLHFPPVNCTLPAFPSPPDTSIYSLYFSLVQHHHPPCKSSGSKLFNQHVSVSSKQRWIQDSQALVKDVAMLLWSRQRLFAETLVPSY
jgi:hypothetical protein